MHLTKLAFLGEAADAHKLPHTKKDWAVVKPLDYTLITSTP